MNWNSLLLATSTAFVLSGCVSSGTYRRSQSETAACQSDKQALLNNKQTLQQQVETLTKEKADLTQAAADRENELAKLKNTYDDVVGNLKN